MAVVIIHAQTSSVDVPVTVPDNGGQFDQAYQASDVWQAWAKAAGWGPLPPPPAPPSAPALNSLRPVFGVHFDGSKSAPAYDAWRKTWPMTTVVAMVAISDPWIAQGNVQALDPSADAAGWGQGWSTVAHSSLTLVQSVAPAFGDMTLVQVAGGAADVNFTNIGKFGATSGFGRRVYRPGWEEGSADPSKDWFPWDLPWDATNYVKVYRRGSGLIKAADPAALFEWNTSDPVNGTGAYPGDDVVDFIGIDLYRFPGDMGGQPGWAGTRNEAAWNATVAFAKLHGKPVVCSEFGLCADDPDYVNGACAAFKSLPATGPGSLGYVCLFQGTPNQTDPTTGKVLDFQLGDKPNAMAALQTQLAA